MLAVLLQRNHVIRAVPLVNKKTTRDEALGPNKGGRGTGRATGREKIKLTQTGNAIKFFFFFADGLRHSIFSRWIRWLVGSRHWPSEASDFDGLSCS
jgi:hypothetical protein